MLHAPFHVRAQHCFIIRDTQQVSKETYTHIELSDRRPMTME